MSFPVKEVIKNRKSVRTFDERPIESSKRATLEKYIQNVENPLNIPVTFRLLDAKQYDLSSPVVVGTDSYIAAKVSRQHNFELGYGYSFETVCLFAATLGLGTVILAASLSRDTFEKAMDVKENEVMPVVTPVGYPAGKKSIRETLMRKGLRADDRIAFEKLFFDGSLDKGLNQENAGVFAAALEAARWAPSAANKQPLRAIVMNDTVHFYEFKTMKDSPLGDVQKVDIGIALSHFDLTMKENGYQGSFIEENPDIEVPEKWNYMISYQKM